MRKLVFQIEAGEDTCFMCKYRWAKRFGTIPVCVLFRDISGTEIELEQSHIGVLRCELCKNREAKDESPHL